jgi:hypothetical protein
MRLLLVGNRSGTNIAGSFERAAKEVDVETRVLETRAAFDSPFLVRQFSRRILGRRPPRLDEFGAQVVEECETWKPDVMLAMGTAPVAAGALDRIRALGVKTVDFATDDPWSRVHRASWFLNALPRYDLVATPRRSNLADFQAEGVPRVEYLPFGYDPDLFYLESPNGKEESAEAGADLLFVGGADRERLPFLRAAIEAGLNVAIHGEYWQKFRATRRFTRGQVGPDELRRATVAAKLSLCLTRRSNRDGHVMRSFEIPASGGCVLAEDTEEHREIFGADEAAAVFFRTPGEMVTRARELLANAPRRRELAATAHARITRAPNRYSDRLSTILDWL